MRVGTPTTAPPRRAGSASQDGSPGGLLSAFRKVRALPALAHSRDAALDLIERDEFSPAEATAAIESDPGLTAAVVAAANRLRPRPGGIRTVRSAVDCLAREELASAIRG